MSFEYSLPQADQIDYMFEHYSDVAQDEIDRLSETTGDILDIELEFSTPTAFHNLDVSSKVIAQCIYDIRDEGAAKRAAQVSYRGLLFGMKLAVVAYGNQTEIDLKQLMAAVRSDSPIDNFRDEVHEFLNSRRHLSTFMNEYSDAIDGGRGYLEIADLSAGYVLMLAERALLSQRFTEPSEPEGQL